MNKFDFLEEMNDNDALLFRKCLRKLLDTTFIVKAKDEKLFTFLAKESNSIDIKEYLRVMGYSLKVNVELGVGMLVNDADSEEESGLKRSNLVTFDANQIKFLLVLWQAYLAGYSKSNEVNITISQIVDRLKFYGVTGGLNITSFRETLALFRRYSLINYADSDIEVDGVVRLYPSLQFCMDIEQLKQVVKDYIPEAQEEIIFESEEA